MTAPVGGETRPLHVIAAEIKAGWTPVNYGAVPYLDAMASLGSVQDRYGADPGTSIVLYFLSNAGQWRGETARRVKRELKDMVGIK